MLFNSLHYLIFFPIMAMVYFVLPLKARRYWLLAGSFYFYGVFSIPLSLLLVYSTVLDYTCARVIDGSKKEWHRRAALMLSLVGNLGVLFTFKYVDFFAQSLNMIAGQEIAPYLQFILPMGISFYTFQTMAYTIDVYRKQIKAERNILDVALYVTYFPQLVAGPIMRAADLMPQFKEKHEINTTRILSGALLVAWGLSKKIFVAEPMGDVVNDIYGSHDTQSGAALLVGTYAFAVQIFCDFSAYTDIAIGSARILGFRLMENFKTPYLAVTIRDFWHRWHISLSTWLRDYLYISLGGNRKGNWRTYINLALTMLLGGLWHGAAWNFVIWGALHGFYLAFERATGIDKIKPETMSLPMKLIGWFVTFHLVCLAWIFFRAENATQAFEIIYGIVTWAGGAPSVSEPSFAPVAILGALLAGQMWQNRMDVHNAVMARPVLARWVTYIALVLCALAMMGGQAPEFIYFQF
jgi:alginate O-acetyltransferase complex protein AlgI